MGTILQDLRYGLRMLAKNPGFTIVAVITLALGIGANTAIFTVVNALVLRPLPYKHADRLVTVQERIPKYVSTPMNLSAPDFVEFERQNQAFEKMAGFQNLQFELSGTGEPERITAARVSASLFPLLGIDPFVGRTFTKEEDRPGVLVAVLSYGLWQRRFGADPNVLGKTVNLDRTLYTIIGVMPRDFQFPLKGLLGGEPAVLWVPMSFTPKELGDLGNNYVVCAVARLKPGVTLTKANADVEVIAHHIWEKVFSDLPDARLEAFATPLAEEVVAKVRTLLAVLLGAVGLVLLIACANVANLLLARATRRQKEIAIRAALGAARFRLLQQFMSESVLLALAGGASGFLFASWGTHLLVRLAPGSLPRAQEVGLDLRVLVFTLALSLVTGLIFGAAPALAASQTNMNETLKEGARSATARPRSHRLRSALVISEVALALILLVASGLLIRSFVFLRETDPGFQPQQVLAMSTDLPRAKYGAASQVRLFYSELLTRIERLPSVRAVGAGTELPMSMNTDRIFTPEGYQAEAGAKWPRCTTTYLMGNYFQALGIPLLRGRLFTHEDKQGSPRVVIISRSIAERYWPGQEPIGKRLHYGPPQNTDNSWTTIIGVVGDVKHGPLDAPALPATYEPSAQAEDFRIAGLGRSLSFAVQTSGDPTSLAAGLRAQVWSLDKELAIADVRAMTRVVDESAAARRFNMLLLGVFASIALLLAAIGVYGVVSYATGQRTHEIGIRMALGADRHDLLRLVVAQGLVLTLIGTTIGLVGALALTRFLSSLLYGVRPTDPLTFCAVSLLLVGVALLASYIPARRATKVDPMVALRYE